MQMVCAIYSSNVSARQLHANAGLIDVCSAMTINRELHRAGFPFTHFKKRLLYGDGLKDRLSWGKRHIARPLSVWKNVSLYLDGASLTYKPACVVQPVGGEAPLQVLGLLRVLGCYVCQRPALFTLPSAYFCCLRHMGTSLEKKGCPPLRKPLFPSKHRKYNVYKNV